MSRNIPRTVVHQTLRNAILTTFREDRQLFHDKTHERSIMFHIGRRVAQEVETWSGNWSVDLEYNRWHHDRLDSIRYKYLHGLGSPEDRSVYPDLIVHDRSGSRPGQNLAVLEAKHSPRHNDREFDYKKLIGFKEQFGYLHAVFLEFPASVGVPRWAWLSAGALDAQGQPTEIS